MHSKLLTVRVLLGATALCASLAAMPANAANAATDGSDSPAAAPDAAPAPVAGPDPQQTETGTLSEITVTAERRATNLVKTPVSISVVSGKDLEDRHVYSLTDMADGSTPGLHVAPYASRPYNMILNIRGIGISQDTNQPALDSGIGVYVDGIYLARPQGLDAGLYDLESVEVLKGPQGTTFGRNTEGGALNITTKKPTGKFGLSVLGGVGNYGSYESQLHLNLPTWHDIAVKVDGMIMSREAFVKNPMAGEEGWGAVRRRGLRVQARWTPAPNFTADYAFDIGKTEDTNTYSYVIKGAVQSAYQVYAQATPVVGHRVNVAPLGSPQQFSPGTQSGHTLTLKWDVAPWLTIKSINAYRELYQEQWSSNGTDALGSPRNALGTLFQRVSLASFTQYQYSSELQFIGETGRFKYLFGVLAFHEKVHDQAQAYYAMQWDDYASNGVSGYSAHVIPLGAIPTVIAGQQINNYYGQPGVTNLVVPLNPHVGVDRASWNASDSFGLYGNVTYTPPLLNDIVHITGGLRWTDDRKHGNLYVVNNYLPMTFTGSGATAQPTGIYAPIENIKSWKRVDPMVNIAIDLGQYASVYGKWGTAYRSGGFNSRSITYSQWDPESVSMFEVGFKGEFLNHHARFNIAGYVGDYKNVFYNISANYDQIDENGNRISTSTRTIEDTFNMPGKGKVSGVEMDFQVIPVRGLTLSGSYTYAYVRMPDALDPLARYVQQTTGPNAGKYVLQFKDPTIYHQLYTPTHAITGAIDYKTGFQGYALAAHVDGNWDSGFYTTTSDTAIGTVGGVTQYLAAPKTKAGAVFNARLSLGDIELAGSGAKMTLSFWIRNLFNAEKETSHSGQYSLATSAVSAGFVDPRQFGGTVGIKF